MQKSLDEKFPHLKKNLRAMLKKVRLDPASVNGDAGIPVKFADDTMRVEGPKIIKEHRNYASTFREYMMDPCKSHSVEA